MARWDKSHTSKAFEQDFVSLFKSSNVLLYYSLLNEKKSYTLKHCKPNILSHVVFCLFDLFIFLLLLFWFGVSP